MFPSIIGTSSSAGSSSHISSHFSISTSLVKKNARQHHSPRFFLRNDTYYSPESLAKVGETEARILALLERQTSTSKRKITSSLASQKLRDKVRSPSKPTPPKTYHDMSFSILKQPMPPKEEREDPVEEEFPSLMSESTTIPWRNFLNLGILHAELGRTAEALVWIKRSLDLNATNALTHLVHATIMQKSGNYTGAVEAYREAIRLEKQEQNPNHDTLTRLFDAIQCCLEIIESSSSSSSLKQIPQNDKSGGDNKEYGMPCFATPAKREIVISTLSKKSELRSDDEIDVLFRLASIMDFMKALPPAIARDLCYNMTYEHCIADTQVIREGEFGNRMYFVLSGTVSAYKSESSANGQKKLVKVVTLTSGCSFGEMALLSNQPRTATCVCDEPCEFLVIHKDHHARSVKTYQTAEIASKSLFLQTKVEIFKHWNPDRVSRIAQYMITRKYSPAQIIVNQNTEADGLIVIVKGNVSLFRRPLQPPLSDDVKHWVQNAAVNVSGNVTEKASPFSPGLPQQQDWGEISTKRNKPWLGVLDALGKFDNVLGQRVLGGSDEANLRGLAVGEPLTTGNWFGVEVARRAKRHVAKLYPSLFSAVANDYVEVMILPKHLCFNLQPETIQWLDLNLEAKLHSIIGTAQSESRWSCFKQGLLDDILRNKVGKLQPKDSWV